MTTATYQRRRQLGQCGNCGAKSAMSICARCRDVISARYSGGCKRRGCTAKAVGSKYCSVHYEEYKAKCKAKYYELLESGRCVYCGDVRDDKKHSSCSACRQSRKIDRASKNCA